MAPGLGRSSPWCHAGRISRHSGGPGARDTLPPYLPDLARIEWAHYQVVAEPNPALPRSGPGIVNPSLELVQCHWRNLTLLVTGAGGAAAVAAGEELVAVWRDTSGRVYLEPASPGDLAALKVLMEDMTPEVAARQAGVASHTIDAVLRQARRRSLILAPPSALRRDPARFAPGLKVPDEFNASQIFTLQWHLTQACDLHCRHCYDRSTRTIPTLAQGLEVLRQVREFCRARRVGGQISFTGGNPFLHPHFYDFYRAAIDLSFGCIILGNPVTEKQLEELTSIGKPLYYQVSLEGLEAHNDEIRGPGNFQRVLSFLETWRQLRDPGHGDADPDPATICPRSCPWPRCCVRWPPASTSIAWPYSGRGRSWSCPSRKPTGLSGRLPGSHFS